MRKHVFAYGSLQIPEVMAAVTGRRFRPLPARLPGYIRYALRSRPYPGVRRVRRHAGQGTAGVLYRDVDALSLARLDAFEDGFYRRLSLPVSVDGEHSVPAEVYVIDRDHYRLFERRPWSLTAFQRCQLKSYLRRCRRGAAATPFQGGTREGPRGTALAAARAGKSGGNREQGMKKGARPRCGCAGCSIALACHPGACSGNWCDSGSRTDRSHGRKRVNQSRRHLGTAGKEKRTDER